MVFSRSIVLHSCLAVTALSGAWRTPAHAGNTSSADARPKIPDTVLVDQFGHKHHFYSDLIKGKTVLVNAIYTTCAGVCPVQTAIFARVQHKLGKRVGRDITMISITLDPNTDTPARLKAFAQRYKADPGWVFLTGPKQDVVQVLRAMDLYAPVPEQHTPIAAVGHEPSGVWMKFINTSSPGDIVGRLHRVEEIGRKRMQGARPPNGL